MEQRIAISSPGGRDQGPTLDVVIPVARLVGAAAVASCLLPWWIAVMVAGLGAVLAGATLPLERVLGPAGRVGRGLGRVADVAHVAGAVVALTVVDRMPLWAAAACLLAAVAIATRPFRASSALPRGTALLGDAAGAALIVGVVAMLLAGGQSAAAAAARPLAWALVWWGLVLAALTAVTAPSGALPSGRGLRGARAEEGAA